MTRQVYRIPSASAPGHRYKVTVLRGRVAGCECPGWTWRGDCRHAKLVRLALLDERPSTLDLVTAPLTVDDLYPGG